jgi:hypothetical protein
MSLVIIILQLGFNLHAFLSTVEFPLIILSLCSVPTLGHHYITECYDDQSSQMEVIASTGTIEGFFGVWLASLLLFHHHDPFRTTWLWLRCISIISVILSYFGLYVN